MMLHQVRQRSRSQTRTGQAHPAQVQTLGLAQAVAVILAVADQAVIGNEETQRANWVLHWQHISITAGSSFKHSPVHRTQKLSQRREQTK